MYTESCGQMLNRTVKVIFVVKLLISLGISLIAQSTLALSSESACPGSTALYQALTIPFFAKAGAHVATADAPSSSPVTLNDSASPAYPGTLTNANTNPGAPASDMILAAAYSTIFSVALTAAHISNLANAGFRRVSSSSGKRSFEQPTPKLTFWQCCLLAGQPS